MVKESDLSIEIIENNRDSGLQGTEGIHTTFKYKGSIFYLASDEIPGVISKPFETMLFDISKGEKLSDYVNYWRFDDKISMEEMHKYILDNPEKYID